MGKGRLETLLAFWLHGHGFTGSPSLITVHDSVGLACTPGLFILGYSIVLACVSMD
jgi:hypothetical protein